MKIRTLWHGGEGQLVGSLRVMAGRGKGTDKLLVKRRPKR